MWKILSLSLVGDLLKARLFLSFQFILCGWGLSLNRVGLTVLVVEFFWALTFGRAHTCSRNLLVEFRGTFICYRWRGRVWRFQLLPLSFRNIWLITFSVHTFSWNKLICFLDLNAISVRLREGYHLVTQMQQHHLATRGGWTELSTLYVLSAVLV